MAFKRSSTLEISFEPLPKNVTQYLLEHKVGTGPKCPTSTPTIITKKNIIDVKFK